MSARENNILSRADIARITGRSAQAVGAAVRDGELPAPEVLGRRQQYWFAAQLDFILTAMRRRSDRGPAWQSRIAV